MTPVAVKNWLMEEHRSAIWAASSVQLLSSACRMLSFRPVRHPEEKKIALNGLSSVALVGEGRVLLGMSRVLLVLAMLTVRLVLAVGGVRGEVLLRVEGVVCRPAVVVLVVVAYAVSHTRRVIPVQNEGRHPPCCEKDCSKTHLYRLRKEELRSSKSEKQSCLSRDSRTGKSYWGCGGGGAGGGGWAGCWRLSDWDEGSEWLLTFKTEEREQT
ncbi:hypothetical protein EYF80_002105 [Liparis tanakae]|uniref:Uncharacterized protein n=1 Tax=Liparis tanakae TaxID=230148 RepID=A0A4Z2JDN4_9TELE|nr:hypothetical protein EYF80_002105 [Liparis tanakae]